MHARAANAYRRVDLESAPKHVVLERLFARFLSDLDVARAALAKKDIQGKANALDHAMSIVAELRASLDAAAAPELVANLIALYDFVTDRLTQTNLTLETKPLDEAAGVMTQLADAFQKAHR